MPVPSFVPLVEFVWPAPPAQVRAPAPRKRCKSRAAPRIDPAAHVRWCRGVAGRMAEALGCRGQERAELIAQALLTMTRRAPKFDFARVPAGGDPDGQFRGWVHPYIRKECQREAIRLRNAGAYRTRREWEHGAPIRAQELPTARQDDGTEVVALVAPEEPDPHEAQAARLARLTVPELWDALYLARVAVEVIEELLAERER